jgi:hypothetical protein
MFYLSDGAIVGLRYNALQEKLNVGLLRLLPVVFGVATSSRVHFRQAFVSIRSLDVLFL